MEFIAHRVNSIKDLKKIPNNYGLEVDLRDYGNQLILQHDPFKNGENFEEYLKHYNHGTIILNIKSEGIEFRVIELLVKYKVKRYFFLDCSFPMIYLLSKAGEKNIAIRLSEFEGLDTTLQMHDRVNWVWIDYFNHFSLDGDKYRKIKGVGLKICLVSPELQKQRNKIADHIKIIKNKNFKIEAVCSKYPGIWKEEFDIV